MKLQDNYDNISLDELLDVVTSSDEEVSFEPLDQVTEFATLFNIQYGEDEVKPNQIYDLYLKWRAQSKNVMTKHAFFYKFGKLFKSYTNGKYRYYLLNGKPFDLTDEESKYNLEEAIRKKIRRPDGKEKR